MDSQRGPLTVEGPVFESSRVECAVDDKSVEAAFLADGTEEALSIRYLKAKLQGVEDDRPHRLVGVVSALSGEGKSTIALALAAARARDKPSRVLLVETDLHRPMLEERLGLARAPGLMQWLSDATDDVLPIREVSPLGFYLLAAGTEGTRSPDLLTRERLERLRRSVRQTFDFVVFDCPPLLPVADSLTIQEIVDGFLLVVRARHTPAPLLRKATSNLKQGRILGTVLNAEKDYVKRYFPTYDAYRKSPY